MLLKIVLPIVLLAFLKYILLSYSYHSKVHGVRASRIQPPRKFIGQLQKKRLTHLVHCTESRMFLKAGQQEKSYPSTDVSVSLQCHVQLILVKFENFVHSIFRNGNSTMEINARHLQLLHCQQWQPPPPPLVSVSVYERSLLLETSTTKIHKDMRCQQGILLSENSFTKCITPFEATDFENSSLVDILAGQSIHTHMLNAINMDQFLDKVIFHVIGLIKCFKSTRSNQPVVYRAYVEGKLL